MKKILYTVLALAACVSLTQCNNFLNTPSPAQSDDAFVTSTVSETFKTLAYCYGTYKSVAGGGNYNWNDVGDAEYYPEYMSNNGRIGYLRPKEAGADNKSGQFNNLFKIIGRCARVADILAEKDEVKNATGVNDWTQLYGEAWTMWAYCYTELVRHFGDVPFGIENQIVEEYTLTSRYDILDACIAKLKEVEGKMYDLGQGGITAERMSRTFANMLIAEANLMAGGYQTLRTDVEGLYGNVSFETMYTNTADKAIFARRSDWQSYYTEAQTYFRKVVSGERKGSLRLITTDDRGLDNPFQRELNYIMDNEVAPSSIFEVGNVAPQQSERPYSQGRPSDGGNANNAPCKVFSGIRVIPTAYYQVWEDGDKRWDASAVVTGSDGKGNEALVNLGTGSRLSGGIAINKWDISKMKEPYTVAPRKSGMNYVFFRMNNTMLKLAEVDLALNNAGEATSLINELRSRAGVAPLATATVDDLILEYKRECIGEGDVKFAEIRTGKFTELGKAMRAELKEVIAGLEDDGYYTFDNGRTISCFVWTKLVDISGNGKGVNTHNRVDGDPVLSPGWRGIYDYTQISAVAGVVTGTTHNLAIEGLFTPYIPDEITVTWVDAKTSEETSKTVNTSGMTPKQLSDLLYTGSDQNKSGDDPIYKSISAVTPDGYKCADWAIKMVSEQGTLWDYNMLSGIELSDVPFYFHPIPRETLDQSKGKVTNGYGLPQV
ncbi:MAG: RagB/SusD family nutrient uptake outer membrane protein [Bacteroidales bacterium]|nr:RagB/SusD family nutrient uptake outer membrane protein [Bacteroidales bacterium]